MKILLYTITECQFSKQEKEYLAGHGLTFEEKNLETNREFLTEMLTVGNNFAGTPVTKVEKDDGTIVVLKGFTKGDFDKTFGFTEGPKTEVAPPEAAPATSPAEVAPPVTQPVTAAPVATPVTADPAMASILTNLEQQAQTTVPQAPPPAAPTPVEPATPAAPATPGTPTIPDPKF